MASFLNNSKSRGLRNNNPGNLIKTSIQWQGKINGGNDAKFEQFTTIEYGLRAMILDITNDIRKGKNTVTKLINEYAPKSENNTAAYISAVAQSLGISGADVIKTVNAKFLAQIVRAILKVELGNYHTQVTDTMIQSALRKVNYSNSENLVVDTSDANAPLGAILIMLFLCFSPYLLTI